jgi:hypothetical protein
MANIDSLQIIDQPNIKYIMGPSIHEKNFKGIDLQLQKGKTLEECNQACVTNNKCLYTSYDDKQKLCTLRGAIANPNMSSGIKSVNSYDIYEKTEIIGTPLTHKIIPANVNNCQKLCTKNTDCDAYTQTGNLCHLKTFEKSPDHTHTWKLIQEASNIIDPKDLNLMNCCMNYTDANNCSNNLPNTKNCDIYMSEFCLNNPHLAECQCINRKNNNQYNKVKVELNSRAGETIRDDCWYPPCKSGGNAYIPSDMIPTTISYYDSELDHITNIDNLKCVGSRSCNIKDIYNPDLTNNCTGMKLSAVAPKQQLSLNLENQIFQNNNTPNNNNKTNDVVWGGKILSGSHNSSFNTSNQLSINGQTITRPVTISQTPTETEVTSPLAPSATYTPRTTSFHNSPSINSLIINPTPNINSSQSIMEHFDQLEGFDQENTSQYSSFNPIRSIKNAGENAYNFINMYNPFPALSDYAETGYNDIKNASVTGIEDIKNTSKTGLHNIENITKTGYNDVKNAAVRAYDDIKNDIRGVNPNIQTKNANAVNYNSLFLVVVLLIIFLIWKYYTQK